MYEIDLISEEIKAAYEEFRKYVADHSDGMKMSDSYKAQVKASMES